MSWSLHVHTPRVTSARRVVTSLGSSQSLTLSARVSAACSSRPTAAPQLYQSRYNVVAPVRFVRTLTRLSTAREEPRSEMPPNKKPTSADPTVSQWAGSPIEMPAWIVQLGVDLPSELDTGPKMLLKRGVDVGRYGLPQHYNIVHLLARTAFMAAHGDAPMYELSLIHI